MGTSGSGKTTLGRRLSAALGVPIIELDTINWLSHWYDLSLNEPDQFVRRVALAIAPDAWVSDGKHGLVRRLIWARATDPIWLDYSRAVIMPRIIGRSLWRSLTKAVVWAATAIANTGASGSSATT